MATIVRHDHRKDVHCIMGKGACSTTCMYYTEGWIETSEGKDIIGGCNSITMIEKAKAGELNNEPAYMGIYKVEL